MTVSTSLESMMGSQHHPSGIEGRCGAPPRRWPTSPSPPPARLHRRSPLLARPGPNPLTANGGPGVGRPSEQGRAMLPMGAEAIVTALGRLPTTRFVDGRESSPPGRWWDVAKPAAPVAVTPTVQGAAVGGAERTRRH